MIEYDWPASAQRRHMRVAIISDIRLYRDASPPSSSVAAST